MLVTSFDGSFIFQDKKYLIVLMGEGKKVEEVFIRYSRTHRVYYVNEYCFDNPAGLFSIVESCGTLLILLYRSDCVPC